MNEEEKKAVEIVNSLKEWGKIHFIVKDRCHVKLTYNEVYLLLALIEKLQKENEELKETYKSEKKMKNEYVKLYQDLLLKEENVISIQKIKDKIEEIDEELEIMKVDNMYGRYKEYGGKTKWERLFATKYGMHDALQELLEGRK